MAFYNIGDSQAADLLELPETGMGFQLVDATFWGDRKRFLVLNASLALDLSGLGIDVSDDPAVLEQNEQRIIEELRRQGRLFFAAPGPSNFRLTSTRVAPLQSTPGVRRTVGVTSSILTSLRDNTLRRGPRLPSALSLRSRVPLCRRATLQFEDVTPRIASLTSRRARATRADESVTPMALS
jgi:hypothetical protein